MLVRLYDAAAGRIRDFEPAAPPNCRLRVWASPDVRSPGGLRLAALCAAVESALSYLGLQVSRVDDPRAEVDLHMGLREPAGPAGLWLKPDPRVEAGERDVDALAEAGFSQAVLQLAFLRVGYRQPLSLGQAELETAREESLRLQATSSFLRSSGGGSAPNPQALAGYRKRLRDALARDLDFPAALADLWAALRPGALSPGSQLAFLKEAAAALSLALP